MAGRVDISSLLIMLVCNIVSIVACIWLLLRFRSMDTRVTKRLFPRQLWHLAVADMINCCGSIANSLITYGGATASMGSDMQVSLEGLCITELSVFMGGSCVSALIETHIAVAFFCTHFRWMSPLQIIQRSLLLIWPLGVALGVTNSFVYVDYDAEQHFCTIKGRGYFLAVLILFGFVVTFIAYTATVTNALCRSSRFPQNVAFRSGDRALLYPLTFFLGYGLLLGYLWYPTPLQSIRGYFVPTLALESLNGFMNVLVYAYNTRYAKRRCGLTADCDQPALAAEDELFGTASFHVAFQSVASTLTYEPELEANDEVITPDAHG